MTGKDPQIRYYPQITQISQIKFINKRAQSLGLRAVRYDPTSKAESSKRSTDYIISADYADFAD